MTRTLEELDKIAHDPLQTHLPEFSMGRRRMPTPDEIQS